jgi:hypothetical protein
LGAGQRIGLDGLYFTFKSDARGNPVNQQQVAPTPRDQDRKPFIQSPGGMFRGIGTDYSILFT